MASPTSRPARPRRRWGRTLFIVVLALLGLLVVVLAILPSVLSLERVKEQIVARAEDALHRKVTLGQVHLQIWTGLGAGLEQVTISNPAGWQSPHFAKIDTLSVKVAFLSLLQGKMEVSKLILRDGDLVIERDAQGRMNYDDLIAPSPDTAGTSTSPAPQETPSGGSPSEHLRVSKVILQDVDIAFIDRMVVSGQTLTTSAQDVQINVANIGLNTPIDFSLSTALLTEGDHNIQVQGQLGPLPETLAFDLVPLRVTLKITALQLAPLLPYMGPEPALTAGQLDADITAAGALGSALDIDGAVSLAQVVLRDSTGTGSPTALPNVTLKHDMTLNIAPALLQLTEANLDLAALQITLKGTIHHFMTTPHLDLQLATTDFDSAAVLQHLPMLAVALPKPASVAGKLRIEGTIKGKPDDLHTHTQISTPALLVKSGTFSGAKTGDGLLLDLRDMQTILAARLASQQPPDVHLHLKTKRLVFDQQTPQAVASTSGPAATEGAASKPASSSPAPPINLRGSVSITDGRIKNLAFQNLAGNFSLIEGLLKSAQSLKTFGGAIQGQVQANLAQAQPDYTLNVKVASLNAGNVVNAFTAVPNVLFGLLNTDLQFRDKGLTWDAISKTLTGTGKVQLNELKLTSFDLMPKLVQGLDQVSRLVGFTIPADLAQRSFDTMKATLQVKQGKIYSDDLKLWGPDLEFLGKGFLGLDRSLQFDGTAVLLGKLARSLGKHAAFLQDKEGRIHLPLAVQGTVTQPRITLNEQHLLTLAQKSLGKKVEEKAGKELQNVLDKVLPGMKPGKESATANDAQKSDPAKQIDKVLKGLFKRQ